MTHARPISGLRATCGNELGRIDSGDASEQLSRNAISAYGGGVPGRAGRPMARVATGPSPRVWHNGSRQPF